MKKIIPIAVIAAVLLLVLVWNPLGTRSVVQSVFSQMSLFSLVCTEYQYEYCTSWQTTDGTTTCTKDYLGSTWPCAVGSSITKSYLCGSCTNTCVSEPTSCGAGAAEAVYCKKCTTTPGTSYCGGWETRTSATKPSSSKSVKNIRCTTEIETCGNGQCEAAYSENPTSCPADCSSIIPVPGDPIGPIVATCESVQVDDGDVCTDDTCTVQNNMAVVEHKQIPSCGVADWAEQYKTEIIATLVGVVLIIAALAVGMRKGK